MPARQQGEHRVAGGPGHGPGDAVGDALAQTQAEVVQGLAE